MSLLATAASGLVDWLIEVDAWIGDCIVALVSVSRGSLVVTSESPPNSILNNKFYPLLIFSSSSLNSIAYSRAAAFGKGKLQVRGTSW